MGAIDRNDNKNNQFMIGDVLWMGDDYQSYPYDFSGCLRWYDGEIEWLKDGKLHRDPDPVTGEVEPASIRPDGSRYWFRHGRNHRADGPAILYANGEAEWFFEGTSYGFGPDKPKDFPV